MSKHNQISIGTMQNSQLQQDAQHSSQHLDQSTSLVDLKAFLEAFSQDIAKVTDQTTAEALRVDVETIRLQSQSPSPKKASSRNAWDRSKRCWKGQLATSWAPISQASSRLLGACEEMDSLVLELQRDVLDRSIHITDLLRKALLVSRKLKISDIEEWLSDELNGYNGKSVPSYRTLTGELKGFNPYRGWIPMMLGDDINDMISVTPIHDSVSQIIDLVERSDGGSVMIKFPQDMSMTIMRMIGRDIEPTLHIPVHQLVRIVDVTKTKILDFALDLETRGILGEGIRFSKAEEQLAQSITYHTINIERMDNSQIQQASDGSNQSR